MTESPPDHSLPSECLTDPECRVMEAVQSTPAIFADLATITGSELHVQLLLRRRYPDDVVRAALSLVELRRKAAVKFARADRMWFDRQGLEQATSEPVARHKAKRFTGRVWDLCCGLGGDALALAATCDVTAVDLKPASCWRTLENARAYDVAERVVTRCADVLTLDFGDDLVHIDPDRRPFSAGRVSRIEDYVPDLAWLQQLIARTRGGAIKVGPASNFGGKFDGVETELISLHGECKEATLWYGELAGAAAYRATVLPSGETLAGHPLDVVAEQSDLRGWIYDPDPAIVRAGLVDLLADKLGLCRLDPAEEYLTGDHLVISPFVQAFAVTAELPHNDREIRAALRGSDIGRLEIKCRHVAVDADAMRRKLPLPGDQPGVLLIARVQGKSV
ncbi:MAG TPA: class I SAM-dependent methyltransferase, partial [Planctomycetaceae bacterium]|nr:class I SAM-dependent methyltransferase [Planctomycetaceae bacterium]